MTQLALVMLLVLMNTTALSDIPKASTLVLRQCGSAFPEDRVVEALWNVTAAFNRSALPLPPTASTVYLRENATATATTTTTTTAAAPPPDLSMDLASKYLAQFIFDQMPPFDVTTSVQISANCRRDGAVYLQALHRLEMWALKMYDASAKIPSGLLNGNINQLGDFDQCLSTESNSLGINGQYCLAYVQVEAPAQKHLAKLHDYVHGHFPFRSNLSDSGHRVPRYSSINWALCIPATCTPKDIEIALNTALTSFINQTGFTLEVKVDPELCQTANRPIPLSTILGTAFFVMIIGFTLAVTLHDFHRPDLPDSYMNAFSLRRNVNALISLKRPEGDIASVHGIRFLNAFMLLLAHKSMALFFTPYNNRTSMAELVGKPWTVLGRAASLYTDPFIMLSGMLTAYAMFGRLYRGQKVNLYQEYVSRLARLIPTLGALILFCTFVLPWIGSGPQWNLVVTHHSDICKNHWWRNLLFIHNYFGFENMCLTHTHHVGIDTQLFAISPVFIGVLWKWPKQGVSILVILATISTIMRYYITYTLRLSNYIHFGTSVSQLFQTADNMYTLPTHRATVYIIGTLLGYILRTKKVLKLSAMQVWWGNVVALVMFGVAFLGPAFMGSIDYEYNPRDAAWYAAFAPIFWCLSFAWIILISHFGFSNALIRLLSSKVFLVTTRLSYAIYLTQFPVFFFNVGTGRYSDVYSFFRTMANFWEYSFVVVLSVVLTLLFDMPFQNMKKLWFKRCPPIKSNQD